MSGGIIPERLPSSAMIGVGVGVGIIPVSRFLRRRAAAEDLGAADVDAFWSAAPRLYDFSQQPQPPQQQPAPTRPPSPSPAPPRSPSPPPPAEAAPLSPRSPAPEEQEEAGEDPCLLLLRRSLSTPPATPPPEPRLVTPPPPAPEPRLVTLPPEVDEPSSASLLTLLRSGLTWGATRSVTYRHRAAERPHDLAAVLERLPAAAEQPRHEEGKARGGGKKTKLLHEVVKTEKKRRVAVKKGEEEGRRVTRSSSSSLRRRRQSAAASRRARKKKTPLLDPVKEEEEVYAAAPCQDHKTEKKKRSRKRERTDRDRERDRRRRGAAKRAKMALLPVKKEEIDDEGDVLRDDKKRKRPAPSPEPTSQVKREVVSAEEEVKVYHRRLRHAAEKMILPKDEEESKPATTLAVAAAKPSSPTGKVDRWAARRYAAGEEALLSILRARGATATHPTPRAELRAEARRYIGDTGLLDHLLLHTADKVPAGSADRIRRRYNVDGALEYFLEPAGLKALRKEAGVKDPFWVPPPGWKLGDPVSPDAIARAVKKQVEELAAELTVVKRQMKKLGSNLVHVSKEAYITWKGYDCMLKANDNLGKELLCLEEKYDAAAQVNGELKEELLLMKENFLSMAEKNSKLEEKMVDLSSCFQFFKDELPLPEIEGGEQHMLMLEPADHCVKGPSKAATDKQEERAGNVPKQEERAGNVPSDDAGASKATTGQVSIGEKRTSRKCGMSICKPLGTSQWPNTSAGMATDEACSPKVLPEPQNPGADLIITNFDAVIYSLAPSSMEEYLAADGLPTPTSASSTTAASTRLPLLPTPASPLQQLSITTARDDNLQTVQPCSGGLDSQPPHKDLSSSSSAPCLLEAGKKALVLGGSNVGTELALATPSY